MTRPVLGIICCTRRIGEESAQAVIDRYVGAALTHADCAGLLVPARPDLMRADEVADRLDGLLLTGSPSNVEPARFGDADDPGEAPFDRGRDAMSLAMIDAMIARGRPVFGICRGFQEINVAFGGTLKRGLSGEERPLSHHAADGAALDAMFCHAHEVALTPGGVLAQAFGRDRLRVNSVHYQGIDRLGTGLSPEATADDGLVEAVSAAVGNASVLGVQWHPEWRTGQDPPSRTLFALFGRILRGERPTPKDHP